jgi:hypothetical protein
MRYAVLSVAVTAFACWYARRHRAALYHRHGRPGVQHHIQRTWLHRAARWVLTARIRIHIILSSNARTV